MKHGYTLGSRAFGTALAALIVFGTAAAEANTRTSPATKVPLYLSFDWHANAKPVAERPVLVGGIFARPRYFQRVFHGSGSHICSLSGAGRRSYCFER